MRERHEGTRNGDYRTVRSTVVRMPSLPPECLLVAAHASSLTPTPSASAPLATPVAGRKPSNIPELSRTALPSLTLAVLAAFPVPPRRVPRPPGRYRSSVLEYIRRCFLQFALGPLDIIRGDVTRTRLEDSRPRTRGASLCEKNAWMYVAMRPI